MGSEMQQKLKLKHGYHDGLVRSVRYRGGEEIVMTVELCGCCTSGSGGQATLTFCGVRNFDEVRAALEAARQENQRKGFIDDIAGIFRDDVRGIAVHFTTAGYLTIDARGVVES